MPKRQRISEPDAQGWRTVGTGRGKLPAGHRDTSPRWLASPSVLPVATEDHPRRSASPLASLMAAEDRPEQSVFPSISPMVTEDCSEAAAGSRATAEGDGAPAVPAASPSRRRVVQQQQPKRPFTPVLASTVTGLRCSRREVL